jgi:hypothetical protein
MELGMTEDEALVEARRRWGDTARVRCRGPNGSMRKVHAVGVQRGCLFVVRGVADSWKEAFRDADRRPPPRPGNPSPAPAPPEPS